MYTIPNEFDALTLIDRTVFQVAYGLNFVTIFFNSGYIQFTNNFVFGYDGNSHSYEVYPVKEDFGLLAILEKKIVNVATNTERNELILHFEDGIILQLLSNEFYESFTIQLDDNRIIV